MKSFKKFSKRLLKNQSGQGMVEYILLLVVIVGVVLAFKGPLSGIVQEKIQAIQEGVGQITTGN